MYLGLLSSHDMEVDPSLEAVVVGNGMVVQKGVRSLSSRGHGPAVAPEEADISAPS